jgi:hypothetical protein
MATPDEKLVDDFAARLRKQGWRVEVRSSSADIEIDLEHPASTRYEINLLRGNRDNACFLDRVFGHREFRVVASRPTEMPHTKLLRDLRRVAQARTWPEHGLVLVAGVLAENDLLSEAEAEWLAAAGPAWSEGTEGS